MPHDAALLVDAELLRIRLESELELRGRRVRGAGVWAPVRLEG